METSKTPEKKQGPYFIFFLPRKNFPSPSRIVIVALILFSAVEAQFPEFNEREIHSEGGYFTLSWEGPETDTEFWVEMATDSSFASAKEWYQGRQKATFISGLASGTYFFRVKSAQSGWSPLARASVDHHSLTLALSLFFAGALLFVLTSWVIFAGNRTAEDNS